MSGPQLPFSQELHAQKYRGEGESFREAMSRIAGALQDTQEHYHAFRDILLDQRFLPGGRVQSAIGSTRRVTPYNCYVSGRIEDSFVEGDGSIMQRATEAAATMRMGGGIGYDFSTLRPRGALIKKLQSRSSGPIAFMEIFDAVCRCVASSGHRRGAQMGVMRVDHPDIEEFIHVKQNQTQLRGFNLSIGVTDEFMRCKASGQPFQLRFGGEVYKEIDAAALWEKIMRSTWDWAEPGVLFIDTINRLNNLYYCEEITATNPCGEQPLPANGACLLGSVNLVKYLRRDGTRYVFDWDRLGADLPHIVRAMDNIVDRAIYPLEAQAREARMKRRMGIGVTGHANCVEALGFPYGSPEFVEATRRILRFVANGCYRASALLAEEKGPFPLFERDSYITAPFITRLDQSVQELIYRKGIRNSHLTSIAPTGTISLTADNVSSGIEPVFATSFERTIQEFDGPRVETVHDYGVRVLGVTPRTARDVTVQQHLEVLAAAQYWVDSAVSKTCNVPSSTSWEEFKQVYQQAWEQGCKGCTTFRIDGKRSGILQVREDDSQVDRETDVVATASEEPAQACYIDPATGKRECE